MSRAPRSNRSSTNGLTSSRRPDDRGGATDPSATDHFASGFDVLLVNGPINELLYSEILRVVTSAGTNNHGVILCLVTYGGTANPAYRIGRLLQGLYREFVAFVPSICKSAGTLVLTAADSLVMSDFGDIGPLDVQLSQRDEIAGRRSGLVTRAAIDDLGSHTYELFENFVLKITQASNGSISFRLAAEIAAEVAAKCMASIYEKISPDALGQDLRDLNIATAYAERLSARSNNLQPNAIKKLVHDYPSHDFVIDLEEARGLFVRVSSPTPSLVRWQLDHMADMMIPRSSTPLVKLVNAVSDGFEEVSRPATAPTVRPGVPPHDPPFPADAAGNQD